MVKPAFSSADHCMGVRALSRLPSCTIRSTCLGGRNLEAMRALLWVITSSYFSTRSSRRFSMPISCPW